MSRADAIARAGAMLDSGELFATLARRIAIPTESQNPDRAGELLRYLRDEMIPAFAALGFSTRLLEHPKSAAPFLVAERIEDDGLPTALGYGHGDVIRGQDERWLAGLSPWRLAERDGIWFGRGVVDNKGQHTINLAALDAVLAQRGQLGFNLVLLLEMGEESGSPGLDAFCAAHKDLLAADVFIASDGPRMQADAPTVFMGSRGVFNFTMRLALREGGHHSGNWGGLLANPGIVMANALASMVDARGRILVDGWRAAPMSDTVRAAIARLKVGGGKGEPEIDPRWGEPGHTPEERVFGTNTFEVRAFETGNPRNPVNAIPPHATVWGHLRFVAGTDPAALLPALRRHLDRHGFEAIELHSERDLMHATRLDPAHPWAQWAIASLARTAGGRDIAVLPNLGGSLPNNVFADTLGLPTIWVPHSYAGCSQHAPNEHVLAHVCRDALRLMTGLWWDLGAGDTPFSR